MTHRRSAAFLALLAVVAVACRALQAWPLVFPHPGEVRFFQADPWFEVRQTHQIVEQYPWLNRWDRNTSYPTGERGMNQGVFDWGMATVAMLCGGGHPTAHLVDLVAAWTPVVLFLVLVAVVFWTASLLMPVPSATLAAVLLVFTPGSLATYSLLGCPNHHVLEDVLRVAMLGTLLRAFPCDGEASRPTSKAFPAVGAAACAVLFLYSWEGAIADLAIAGLAILLAGCTAVAEGMDAGPIRRFCFRYGVGVPLLYFPVAWMYPDAVMWEKSRSYVLLGGLGIALLIPVCLQAMTWLRSGRRAAGLGVVAALGVAATAAATSPPGRWALDFLLTPRSPTVAEQQPATLHRFLFDYGLVGVLALYAAVTLVQKVSSRQQPPAPVLLLVFSGAWLGLWWHTWDFIWAPPPFVALLAAAGTADWQPSRGLNLALVALQVTLCALGLASWPWPTQQTVQGLMIADDNWMSAMAWLRHDTPPIPPLTGLGPLRDPVYPPGTYGVFTAWDDGEYVAGPGGRPCLWSEDMTPDYAKWLFETDEPRAVDMLHRWAASGQRVRYVVLDSRMGTDYLGAELHLLQRPFQSYFQPGPRVAEGRVEVPGPVLQDTMWYQLYRKDARSLSRFRLVYETPGQVVAVWTAKFQGGVCDVLGRTLRLSEHPEAAGLVGDSGVRSVGQGYVYGATETAEVKVFEAVPGAHLVGQSAPDVAFTVSLWLRAGASGRTFEYLVRSRSSATGSFNVVVPYPTAGSDATDVVATGTYQLHFGSQWRQAVVSYQDVETGADVQVPP